jgi:hypothetical protein
MSKPRNLRKVYYAFYDCKRGSCAYPVIRLGGKFLEEFGFEIGDGVHVLYEAGKITITKLEVAEDGTQEIYRSRSESESGEADSDPG